MLQDSGCMDPVANEDTRLWLRILLEVLQACHGWLAWWSHVSGLLLSRWSGSMERFSSCSVEMTRMSPAIRMRAECTMI